VTDALRRVRFRHYRAPAAASRLKTERSHTVTESETDMTTTLPAARSTKDPPASVTTAAVRGNPKGTPMRDKGERLRTRRGLVGWLTTPWPQRYRPWSGRATSTDLLLMSAFGGVVLLGIAIKPIKPFLLASHPVALELLTGDLIPIGAAAAFARVGEVPLWVVIVAGAVGMAKFDWLMWWAGRRWGEGIIRMFTTGERARRYTERAAELNPWVVRSAVVAAVLPGVPTPIVYAMAGLAGMRLVVFLALDLVGTLVITGIVAGLGYRLGQNAVDLVLLIDRYASLASLALVAAMFLIPWVRGRLRRRREYEGHAHV
jgi:membrane protein DedA with SNARE-associated domain